MSRLFLAPVGAVLDLNTISLGLASILHKDNIQTTFFEPVANINDKKHGADELAKTQLNLLTPKTLAITDVEHSLAHAKEGDLLDEIVANFFSIHKDSTQPALIEGVSCYEYGFVPSFNIKIAQTLSCKTILIIDAKHITPQKIAAKLSIARQAQKVPSVGFILKDFVSGTFYKEDYLKAIEEALPDHLPCLGVIALKEMPANSLEEAINYIASSVDAEQIKVLAKEESKSCQTPAVFRYNMIEKARKANKRIVLPEGDEPRTIQAAAICHEKGIAHCVLLGEPSKIKEVAQSQGISLAEGFEIISPATIKQNYIAPMVELRKSKGLTPEQASEQLEDSVILGTMMLAQGDVDGLVSGAVHTTADTVRPALQLIKTRPNESLVSSVFFMLMPDDVAVFGDCAINPNPNSEQLADIAIQSTDSAKAFGIDPHVAMISYSTGKSGTGEAVEKVTTATDLVKNKRPDILVDGPLQYDAATVPAVAKQKAPQSKVAGRANVIIVPDLNTGNTTYKAVQRTGNLTCVGPMLQGLRKPVNDLSRGALVEDIVYTIALTAIQATQL